MKKYSWYLLFLCVSVRAVAQEALEAVKLTAVETPSGMLVSGMTIPADSTVFLVERDGGEGFEVVGNLTAPSTFAMFKTRVWKYAAFFSDQVVFTDEGLHKLWDTSRTPAGRDSIRNAGLPVITLAMGGGYLDTLVRADPSRPVSYRIRNGEQQWTVAAVFNEKSRATKILHFYELTPADQVIRAEWRMAASERPSAVRAYRLRLGIDSTFRPAPVSMGIEPTPQGDSLRVHLSDTTVMPGITYIYRLAGLDPFAHEVGYSDTLRSIAGARATVTGIDRFQTMPAPDSSGVKLVWEPVQDLRIRSIRVFRSPYYDSAYVQLAVLPPTDTVYIDRYAGTSTNYYYQLVGQGSDDFSYPSSRVFGSFEHHTPLLPPADVQAFQDGNAIAVTWHYMDFANLAGFRVYRSLGNSGEFQPISGLIAADRSTISYRYPDSLQQLDGTGLYVYAVATVSRSHAEGPLSELVPVNMFSTEKPAVPVYVRGLEEKDSTFVLTWKDMRPVDERVIGYHVYRKAFGGVGDTSYHRVTPQPIIDVNEFVDDAFNPSGWQYVVRSVSQSDSSEVSLPVVWKPEQIKPLPPGRVQLYADAGNVWITWDRSLLPNLQDYHIYRVSEKGEPQRIATVSVGSTPEYVDKEVKEGVRYYYYVTTETSQQVESDFSRETMIRLDGKK